MRPLIAAVLVAASLSACSADISRSSGGGACAPLLDFDGHRYAGHGDLVREPALTGRTDRGVTPSCDDGNGAEPEHEVQVQELADVPMDRAVLVDGTVYVREDQPFPEQARIWFQQPRCLTNGSFELRGQWLSVQGPHQIRVDGDLRPPYRVGIRVRQGPDEYVGTTVMVRATRDTDPLLAPRDVKTSLWRGGDLAAQVGCRDGRFVARALRSTPG